MTASAVLPHPCPACAEQPALVLTWPLFAARPLGTWSLAGHQLKTSAIEYALVRCGHCGWSVTGDLVDGDFVAHPDPEKLR